MNQHLSDTYTNLPPSQRDDLKSRLKESPRALLLLEFIERSPGKHFSTRDVVSNVYGDEMSSTSFGVLQNRFFKLRKKILDLIAEGPGTEDNLLLPLEKEFYECRRIVGTCNYRQALLQLKKLQQECLRLNVFELLPGTVDLMLYCCQATQELSEIDVLLTEQEKANLLLSVLQRQQMLARQAYLISSTKTYDAARPLLRQMQQTAQRYEAYPRFLMHYHLTSVLLGAAGFGNEPHALSRHIRALNELSARYPDVPLGHYEHNGKMITQYYLAYARCGLSFYRGETEEAYSHLMECWRILTTTPGMRFRITEGIYLNRMSLATVIERYREAIDTGEEYLQFLRNQNKEEQRLRAYSELAQIYLYAYPQIRCPDPEFFLSKVDAWIRHTRSHKLDAMHTNALNIKAAFLFFYGSREESYRFARRNQIAKLSSAQGQDIFNRVYGVLERNNSEELKKFEAEVNKLMYKETNTVFKAGFRLLKKMLRLAEKG
jgi:hypothetical protein